MGNIKIGPKTKKFNSIHSVYIMSDWTYVPNFPERFWENFIRIGIGYQIFPFHNHNYFLPLTFAKRARIYFEYVNNVAWLGNEPSKYISNCDFRIGFAFSTDGYFKEH